jgi:putative MFS transporter
MSDKTPGKTNKFLVRLTAATGGGMFLDGFMFAAIAAVLAQGTFKNDLDITGVVVGLVSAATLIGTLIGSPIIGYVTDRLGRKPMFLADMLIFLVCSLLMLGVANVWEFIVLGILWGVAIGGDYAIGSPLLAEYVPARNRGNYLCLLEIGWNAGYVLSYVIGFAILSAFPHAWPWELATPVVPVLIILALRHGLPESPRWLISKGREEEARKSLARAGWATSPSEYKGEQQEDTRWTTLFRPEYIARTIFCCVFWICIVLPYFSLTFFQAEVLGTIGLANEVIGAIIGTCLALVGATTGWFLIDRVGRRPLLIVPMFGTAFFLAVVGLNKIIGLSVGITVICFFGYFLTYGVMSILAGVYPVEVFPTSVRTSGEGVSSAASRVGAAVGTFLLPVGLSRYGLSPVLFVLAGVGCVGGITSFFLAPETAGKTLTETGGRAGTGRKVARS